MEILDEARGRWRRPQRLVWGQERLLVVVLSADEALVLNVVHGAGRGEARSVRVQRQESENQSIVTTVLQTAKRKMCSHFTCFVICTCGSVLL